MMRIHEPDQVDFRSVMPEDMDWAKPGAYVTQVSAIGPLGRDYLDPIDDPRNK